MKKNIRKALALVMALTLVACQSKTTDTDQNKEGFSKPESKQTQEGADQKLDSISIILDWTPNTNHTGLFVAQELGYFEEEGLHVEIKQPPEGGSTALVGGGDAEFGIDFQDSLAPAFSNEHPIPVTAVAAIIQHNTSGLISLKDKGIDSPKKLEGKTYASWDMPIEKATIREVVENDGGDYDKINIIPNTVQDVLTALKSDVDSIWVFYGWDGVNLEVNNEAFDYLYFKDYAEELDFYTPVIVANNDYLKNYPEQAKAALRAIQKGYEYAIENPEKAADILLKAVPELDKNLIVASQKWLANQYQADAKSWGQIDSTRWNAYYAWLKDKDLIEKEIPENFGFSNEFLSK